MAAHSRQPFRAENVAVCIWRVSIMRGHSAWLARIWPAGSAGFVALTLAVALSGAATGTQRQSRRLNGARRDPIAVNAGGKVRRICEPEAEKRNKEES